MKHKVRNSHRRKYYITIAICLILIFCIEALKSNTAFVEQYYAQNLYPAISYMYIILFSWLPFSIGDVLYSAIVLLLAYNIFSLIKGAFQKNSTKVVDHFIYICTTLSVVYVVFYLNWGLNYFRQPVAEKLGLHTYEVNKEEHLEVLDKYIKIANELRQEIELENKTKNGVKGDLVEIVRHDTLLNDYLCKSQVNAKSPLSSDLISYFTVSGYFNPFTLEVQVNQNIPNASYPFTTVHELTHQMGVGFEDECNFIAFLTLHDDKDVWYQYSAYYAAIGYLMQPLARDKKLFESYRDKFSPLVLDDFKQEREFWQSYRGWLDRISSVFYNQFLKHNNQPEGLERYNLMTTLLVAWEKQQEELR